MNTMIRMFLVCIAALFLASVGLPKAFAVDSDGVWNVVPSMAHSHCLGATVLLRNGKVLVTAGVDSSGFTATSELFDSTTETWSSTGNIHQLRHNWLKNLVNLSDGRALLVGGADAAVTSLSSVEIYDPNAGAWTLAASMNVPRRQPAVVALQDGRVLAAAGANGVPDGGRFLSSAEIYDPGTNTWTYTGNVNVAREVGAAVLLEDGRVLIVGGEGPWFTLGFTADVYNPATETWTLTGPFPSGRSISSLIVLPNGKALAAGGSGSSAPLQSTLLYDPATNSWTETGSMLEPRTNGSLALLSDGKVLLMGGSGASGQDLQTTEIYDPATGTWSAGPLMNATHNNSNELSMLPNGDSLLIGACPTHTLAERFTSPVHDSDGDGIADDADNCPDLANSDQRDTDQDGQGDGCDSDDDNDGILDASDNCPLDQNPDQADSDHDGAGNVCDSDDDNDGVIDGSDLCVPTPVGQTVNSDGCSIPNLCPCDVEWKNHGAYVSCVTHAAQDFIDLGLISGAEKNAIVSAAGNSQCGK